MKIIVINGVNLNMLGVREPQIYGSATLNDLEKLITDFASEHGVNVTCYQSNHEGDIVDKIQQAYYDKVDGIIINAGAYTHTSIAILDALKATSIKTVEVHISDIAQRENFRHHSYISLYAEKVIVGKGFMGYCDAIKYLADALKK